MGNRQNTTASQGSSLGAELEQTERTRAWLAEVGFVDDQAVSEAIEHCGTDHKKCVRYLMDTERVTTEQLLGERPQGSEPVRIRSQSEPPAEWAAAAEMIAAAHSGELPVSQCARSVPTSTLEMSPFDLESLALCSICLDSPKRFMAAPCNHMVWCSECAEESPECPICRSEISGIVELALNAPQADDLRAHAICQKCNLRQKSVMFCGCNHCTLCDECAQDVSSCPLCPGDLGFKKTVYF